jgi:thiamine biosynthesis lipoprotein
MDANGYDRPFAELISAPAVAVRPPQATPGCGEIELDDRRRSIRLPQGVRIDPGGIGKGLAADMVAAEIMRAGAAGVLVNIGGDMVALGQPPEGDTWAVVVDEPTVCPMPLTTVTLDRGALATSVTTRRRWATDDGDRHHLIDPRTGGSTAAEIVLVSALACEGWLAEIATKAHVVGRVSPALASVPALVLHADGRLEAHAGFHEHMADLDLAPAPLEEVLT